MIVRERPDSFLLFEQHEHALVSAEFGRRWRDGPRPLDSTLYAVANHDLAWRELDGRVLWDEERELPHSFVSYPVEPKLRAQKRGIEAVEERDPYAACLCSMHYVRFLLNANRPDEIEFRENELARQERLRGTMSGVESDNLERNFRFLRLCDGLSLFVCLNEPGDLHPAPPYPGGFEFDGRSFEPVWEDEHTLRLDPNPFTEAFEVELPYRAFGKDRQLAGSGVLELRVSS